MYLYLFYFILLDISMLGSLQLHFCVFQMAFCWSVCVAFSFLFNTFNNRKSETIYDTKTRQSKNRMHCLCNSFLILFFSKSTFPEIHKNMIVSQSFCVPKVLKRARKHENRFTHKSRNKKLSLQRTICSLQRTIQV